MAPRFTSLPDGRLHFSHGPIDLIIQADGHAQAIRAAHEHAWQRFETVLFELAGELPLLQRPVGETCPLGGAVARRMWQACHPFRASWITPMAAVAGAVAQEIIESYAHPGIGRAAVNNGGDIAFYLGAGASYRVGVCTDIVGATHDAMRGAFRADGTIVIVACMPVRGIATSGWRGRSFSPGIADSVTVLAATAAQADAAATVIANAVNIDDARIARMPANRVKDNSDLGDLPVTVDVPLLERALVEEALRAGLERARRLQAAGLIHGALLTCQGRTAHLENDMQTSMTASAPTHASLPVPGAQEPANSAHRLSAVLY